MLSYDKIKSCIYLYYYYIKKFTISIAPTTIIDSSLSIVIIQIIE